MPCWNQGKGFQDASLGPIVFAVFHAPCILIILYSSKNYLSGADRPLVHFSLVSYTWTLAVERGDVNCAVFLDIKKAFDTIDHRILVNKLSQYGVVRLLKFFKSYISERVQCCSGIGYTSTLGHLKYGVLQGSILGPLLFIIYMNDLPNVVRNGKICMYADDTNLSTKVNKVSGISDQLIPEFTNILNWLRENRLSPNFIKTKFMLIGSIQKIQPLNNLIAIRVNGRLLKRV